MQTCARRSESSVPVRQYADHVRCVQPRVIDLIRSVRPDARMPHRRRRAPLGSGRPRGKGSNSAECYFLEHDHWRGSISFTHRIHVFIRSDTLDNTMTLRLIRANAAYERNSSGSTLHPRTLSHKRAVLPLSSRLPPRIRIAVERIEYTSNMTSTHTWSALPTHRDSGDR